MAERDNEIKGATFTLSVLHVTDAHPGKIRALLESKVAQAPHFFHCAPIVMNVEKLENIPDFSAIKQLVEAESFILVGITGARSEAMKTAAKAAGIAVMNAGRSRGSDNSKTVKPTKVEPAKVEPPPLTPTRVHVGPVRSGQQIYAAGASLVVLGSVSPGAEVIADDSIHVYGALRGRAIAGARGNTQARIYCQQLAAELLSIAGTFQLSDTLPASLIQKPAHVRFDNEQLRIDSIK
ncbi:septum site-determining protein MinC [Aeromonas simiae]|uniref:septum site-determining protein MinC n=1 Tax=Aeromonas simiae TaxID=218936 RepID=UPI00266C109E|nr:septum site-determining protein MinC [Aeromonas simiae]MDO2947848.1 septum site-determining protein MinC [Aeromonas simiae]MDO2950979.1 septum site-determining protein MinC [Aeromonas simiae]MDO2955256.1 septum site-determining protein MinC [Aeromonas simiae]